tara:strand:- start:487 stop:849 length:363 start_codon:yes stop_codon:yes gene_type:complete
MASSASEANQRQCDTTICASRLRCARRAARAASGDIGDADARDGVEVVGCGWDDAEARPGVDAEARTSVARRRRSTPCCVIVVNPSATTESSSRVFVGDARRLADSDSAARCIAAFPGKS